MTVGELIHLLKDLPEDDEIFLEDINWCFNPTYSIRRVIEPGKKEKVCIEMEEV